MKGAPAGLGRPSTGTAGSKTMPGIYPRPGFPPTDTAAVGSASQLYQLAEIPGEQSGDNGSDRTEEEPRRSSSDDGQDGQEVDGGVLGEPRLDMSLPDYHIPRFDLSRAFSLTLPWYVIAVDPFRPKRMKKRSAVSIWFVFEVQNGWRKW